MQGTTFVIACGALAREILALKQAHGWQHLVLHCLPADLHNRPEKIPAAVREAIHAGRAKHARVFVAYGDCGTGGLLDRVLEEEGVERIEGAHCYEFYAGSASFAELAEAAPGTFYLTDFLVRHFDRLVIEELGIRRHPELAAVYFGNYTRVFYLAQTNDPQLLDAAREIAQGLGLTFEHRFTGYGGLAQSLQLKAAEPLAWQH